MEVNKICTKSDERLAAYKRKRTLKTCFVSVMANTKVRVYLG